MFASSEASSSSTSLSLDELRWLEASAILELTSSPSTNSYDPLQPLTSAQKSIFDYENGLSVTPTDSPLRQHCTTPPLSPPTSRPKSPLKRIHHTNTRPTPPSTPPRHPLTPPRSATSNSSSTSEWIYRRPKSPMNSRPVTPISPRRTHALSHHGSNIPQTHRVSIPRPSGPRPHVVQNDSAFWSTILRPRSRSERSLPTLKAIPSQPQIILTPTSPNFAIHPASPLKAPFSPVLKPKRSRPSSISSTVSSSSELSSRPETPTSPYKQRHSPQFHRRHVSNQESRLPHLSASCPPSRSILTRTSSISTKNSASVSNKSVKFVEMPTVHYASVGYWNLETIDCNDEDDSLDMGIDMACIDLDVNVPRIDNQLNPSLSRKRDDDYLDFNHFGERPFANTPTSQEKPKGLRRFMCLSRKSSMTNHSDTSNCSITPTGQDVFLSRPNISGPFTLGTPTHMPMPPPSPARSAKLHKGRSVSGMPSISGPIPLRSAPSYESFRSTRSAGSRSIKSMGSLKSTVSTRGFRSWLSRVGLGGPIM